jgi:hypothetical protein
VSAHLVVTRAVRTILARASQNPLGYVLVRSDRDASELPVLEDLASRGWVEVVMTYKVRTPCEIATAILAKLHERGRDAARICAGEVL